MNTISLLIVFSIFGCSLGSHNRMIKDSKSIETNSKHKESIKKKFLNVPFDQFTKIKKSEIYFIDNPHHANLRYRAEVLENNTGKNTIKLFISRITVSATFEFKYTDLKDKLFVKTEDQEEDWQIK